MIIATANAYNPATGKVDLPQTYEARDRLEAVRWARCNRDYLRDVKIDGENFLV